MQKSFLYVIKLELNLDCWNCPIEEVMQSEIKNFAHIVYDDTVKCLLLDRLDLQDTNSFVII